MFPIPTGILSGAAGSLGGGSMGGGAPAPSSSATATTGDFQGGTSDAANVFGSGVRGFVNNYAARGARVDSTQDSKSQPAGIIPAELSPEKLALFGTIALLVLMIFRK